MENLVSSLVKVEHNRPEYAKFISTQLNVNSVTQHHDRLFQKQNFIHSKLQSFYLQLSYQSTPACPWFMNELFICISLTES